MRPKSVGLGFAAMALVGCSADLPASFDAPDAGSRIRAVVAGAALPSERDLRGMVHALDSDDPALRTLAIAALERTTGERFGYDPWATQAERRAASGRWRHWLASRDGAEHPDFPMSTTSGDATKR